VRRKRGVAPQEDPAAELRRKLAATRETEPVVAEEEPLAEATPPADADARRREVHEEARAAIDEMRGADRPE
jgi:hypothetical protein